ncbi:(R)-2-hydroxyisocaproyl-CoA dehydratase alpha subunit [bioreactor metagenome]|uniref:(R)-2-hydroxyisocaproyl-CoA dehydratase alpha subunit n=1 Tax=bioreactor metagenome TaxID=1076179 RepID=A0A645GD40_9ZZZZ
MKISTDTALWWRRATDLAKHKPSPLNGFDMFNFMAMIVCARGKESTRDLYKLWHDEMAEKVKTGDGPWRDGAEKYRIMWDGIACWPYLGATYKTLKNNGINMVTSTYPESWTIVYEKNDLDGMARAYSANYANRNLDYGTGNIIKLVRDFDLDGIVYHSNRSCKLMDFRQYEVQRRIEKATGVPSVVFDGDQTDPRIFSQAQYETRIQALMEMMEKNKERRRGGGYR